MAWVQDSRSAGYLGPEASPQPLQDDPFTDFLQQLVAGITGIEGSLVRPRWQSEPPNQPDINVDWAAVGVTDTQADPYPYMRHVSDGDGHDELIRHESFTLFTSFYGPNGERNATYLREGIFVDQNRAELRRNGMALQETGGFTRLPELFRQRFRSRIDMNVIFRREIRLNYAVRNLVSAKGTIIGNDAGNRAVTVDWDSTAENL